MANMQQFKPCKLYRTNHVGHLKQFIFRRSNVTDKLISVAPLTMINLRYRSNGVVSHAIGGGFSASRLTPPLGFVVCIIPHSSRLTQVA